MENKEPKTTDKPKKKKHKVKGMHVRKADSGGYVANHEMMPDEVTGALPPPQEHVLPDIASLRNHITDHFGDEEESEAHA